MSKAFARPDTQLAQHPAPPLVAVYKGPSMNPTLVAPALLDIVPYASLLAIRPGDVIFFQPPGRTAAVVHRVLRVTAQGVITRGDNNPADDPGVTPFAAIAGRVVGAQRGARRRLIRGGRAGLRRHYLLRGWRWAARGVARLLHGPYHALMRAGLLRRWLPARWRGRVVHLRGTALLLLGGQVIGRYDPTLRRWQIRRPFRLLVDEAGLPAPDRPTM